MRDKLKGESIEKCGKDLISLARKALADDAVDERKQLLKHLKGGLIDITCTSTIAQRTQTTQYLQCWSICKTMGRWKNELVLEQRMHFILG